MSADKKESLETKCEGSSGFKARFLNRLTPKERWVIVAVMVVLVLGGVMRYGIHGSSFAKPDVGEDGRKTSVDSAQKSGKVESATGP